MSETYGYGGGSGDLDGYSAANATCRAPLEGEATEVSYCRFLNAIVDATKYDQSLSFTGIRFTGSEESRLQAAVRLYDEALQIAPAGLVEDLRTLREAFQRIPGSAR